MVVGNRLTDVACHRNGYPLPPTPLWTLVQDRRRLRGYGISRQIYGSERRTRCAGARSAALPARCWPSDVLTLGTTKTVVLDDKWAVTTAEVTCGTLGNTVAVTNDGPRF